MMTIAKVFVILAICTSQCLSWAENQPAANSMAEFSAKSSEMEKRLIKRAAELTREDTETAMRAGRFNFEESEEDFDNPFDPYLRAVSLPGSLKTAFNVVPKDNQAGSAQTRGISLRSSVLNNPNSDNLDTTSKSTTDQPSEVDNLRNVQINLEVQKAAQNTGINNDPAENDKTPSENVLGSNVMGVGMFSKSVGEALEPLMRSLGIKDLGDTQTRSLSGLVTGPFNLGKNIIEGLIHLVEKVIKKVIVRCAIILNWILPNWIYRAIIPREIMRLVDEKNQLKQMRQAEYGVNYSQLVQQNPMRPSMQVPNQSRQQPNYRPRPLQYGKRN